MMDLNTVRKRFYGKGAEAKLGVGYRLLAILHNQMRFNQLDQLVMRKWVDGTYFEVSSVFGQNEIRIFEATGEQSLVDRISQYVGYITSSHIVWGNLFPASVLGYFGGLGEPVHFFSAQKEGLLRGLKKSKGDMIMDESLALTRISLVSPATYKLGSYNRNVYAYLLTLDQLDDYAEFGNSPFKQINIANWHYSGPVVEHEFVERIRPSLAHYRLEYAFRQGYEFYATFFNQVRVPLFCAEICGHYFREQGNVYNAKFDDDTTLPVQDKYAILDNFAGVFTDAGVDKFSSELITVEEGFDGLYGQPFIDYYDEIRTNLMSYWYVSQVIFDPGVRLMRCPTEVEQVLEGAKAYEQEVYADDSFNTVPVSAQSGLLERIGQDIANEIRSKQVARIVSQAGADFDHRMIKALE